MFVEEPYQICCVVIVVTEVWYWAPVDFSITVFVSPQTTIGVQAGRLLIMSCKLRWRSFAIDSFSFFPVGLETPYRQM